MQTFNVHVPLSDLAANHWAEVVAKHVSHFECAAAHMQARRCWCHLHVQSAFAVSVQHKGTLELVFWFSVEC